MTKSGAGAMGVTPPLPHKSIASAPDALELDAERFKTIFANGLDVLVKHLGRHPTNAEIDMLTGAVLRHLTDPDAHQVLQ